MRSTRVREPKTEERIKRRGRMDCELKPRKGFVRFTRVR